VAEVTFLTQAAPVDEYGRALYAVARSVVRAMLDQIGKDDLTDLGCDRDKVTMRQLSKLARLDRDKGMRGDGLEWAIHEAVVGGEPRVTQHISEVLSRVSRHIAADNPTSLMFGHERAKYLGFTDAVIQQAGEEAVLLPGRRGHPYAFGPWVALAALGKQAESALAERIQQIWKTDLFLSDGQHVKYVAATVKSDWHALESGRGLRIGIVPEAPDLQPGVKYQNGLWLVSLPDPNGFMGLFNEGYMAVAGAVCTLGKHERPPYYTKPSAKAQRVQEQIEKYPTATVVDIVAALDEAAQQNLVEVDHQLVSVAAPPWLHIMERDTSVIAPRPRFEKLD